MKNFETKLIEIFCHVDDFNKVFINELQTHQLVDPYKLAFFQIFQDGIIAGTKI